MFNLCVFTFFMPIKYYTLTVPSVGRKHTTCGSWPTFIKGGGRAMSASTPQVQSLRALSVKKG